MARPRATVRTATATQGVTADTIKIATFSDPGFEGRAGLEPEMFDTADRPSSAWCNEHGGINGRKIDIKLARRQADRVPTARDRSVRRGRLLQRRRRRGLRRHRTGRPARMSGLPVVFQGLRGHRGGIRLRPVDPTDPEPGRPGQQPIGAMGEVDRGDLPRHDRQGGDLPWQVAETRTQVVGDQRRGSDGAAWLGHRVRRLVQPSPGKQPGRRSSRLCRGGRGRTRALLGRRAVQLVHRCCRNPDVDQRRLRPGCSPIANHYDQRFIDLAGRGREERVHAVRLRPVLRGGPEPADAGSTSTCSRSTCRTARPRPCSPCSRSRPGSCSPHRRRSAAPT